MIAQFQAECGICIGDIDEGVTEITYDSEHGWIHADSDECDDEHPDNDNDEFVSG